MRCIKCLRNKAVYTVLAPICMTFESAPLCPTCFQEGIDEGEIVWIGDKPIGICTDCEAVSA